MIENLPEKLRFIMDSYQKCYGAFPNCVIAPDTTIQTLGKEKYLRDHGKEKIPYSGWRLETGRPVKTKVYWLGRFEPDELASISGDGKLKSHKSGGIMRIVFATETGQVMQKIHRVERFSNPLFCDFGVPNKQLAKEIDTQLE